MSILSVMIHDTICEMESYDEDDTPREGQPPLSPAGGAESLFLAGLATSKISAEALSNRLRLVHKYSGSLGSKRSISGASSRSVLTDDFHSCAQYSDEVDFPITDDEHDSTDDFADDDTSFFSLFRSPANRNKMSSPSFAPAPAPITSMKKKPTPVTPVASTPPPKQPTPSPEEGMDVADHVYEKAKSVWAWGKSIPLVSIGFGITEAVVGKAVSVVGTDFASLDKQIKPQLKKFDHDIMDPAIKVVIDTIMMAANKSEGFVKPIIIKILSPFGLIKNEAENPEFTN